MLLLRHIIVMVFPFLVLFDLPMGCGVGVDKFASFGKMCPEGRWSRAGAKRISTIFYILLLQAEHTGQPARVKTKKNGKKYNVSKAFRKVEKGPCSMKPFNLLIF